MVSSTYARSSHTFHIDAYGGDPTGATDSTAAFNAALAAMPTTSISGTPFPTGTLVLGAGTYKIGSSGNTNNIGPLANLIGAGRNATKVAYYGTGDCIRMYNTVRPSTDTFDTLGAFQGIINGFIIDGTAAGNGAKGLHYGDTEGGVLGPDLMIQNFTGTGAVGLHIENVISWSENIYGRVNVANCTDCVILAGGGGTNGDASLEYSDLTFKVYCFANQNGVTIANGGQYNNGSLKIRANVMKAASAQTGALLTITGQLPSGHIGAGTYTALTNSRLDIQAEANGAGAYPHMTVKFGDNNNNTILGCTGILSFSGMTVTNWAGSQRFNIVFHGIIVGDNVLSPANTINPVVVGGTVMSRGVAYGTGQLALGVGDLFNLTLSQNATVTLTGSVAAPQSKTVVIQQPGSGGPYTVTWPHPGSPTLSSPTVRWANGVAPTMSPGAGAIDTYRLVTTDGIYWYGSTVQNMS